MAAPAIPALALAPRRVLWPEPDVLRGLAGLAAVVNHTAVAVVPAAAATRIAPPDRPLSMGVAAWAGSAWMAFLLITGVGPGVQARPEGGRAPEQGPRAAAGDPALLALPDRCRLPLGGEATPSVRYRGHSPGPA